jgi:integrase
MIKADLKKADIPVKTALGVVDFHALRHTFITRLARSGVSPAVAKTLARHSTITLTMDRYTHTLMSDQRAALNRLPNLDIKMATNQAIRTGTDGDLSKTLVRVLVRSWE